MSATAIIFDFDGVIVQSEAVWPTLENAYFQTIASSWTDADHHRIVGMSVTDTYRFLGTEFGITVPKEYFFAWYDGAAAEVYEQSPLTEGLRELLGALEEHGFRLAVASSASRPHLIGALEHHGIVDRFEHIVSADDLGGALSKPDPAIYLRAASGLHLDPSACVAIEDAANGIASAKDAGMRCIAVSSAVNAAQDISRADAVVDIRNGFTIEEILGCL